MIFYGVLIGIIIYPFVDPFFVNSLPVQLFIILYILIGGICYFNGKILYPFVWLAPFMVLYNVSIYIVDILGVRPAAFVPIIFNCVYLSLSTLFLYCVCFIKISSSSYFSNNFFNVYRVKVVEKALKLLGFLLLCYIPLFLESGYTSKMDTNLNGGLPGLGFVSRLFIFFYISYMIYTVHVNGRFPIKVFVFAILITLSISLFIGERDIFLFVVLCSFLVFYYYFRPSFKKVALIAVICLTLEPILGVTKQITNKEEIGIFQVNLVVGVFKGEFFSSGHNIEVLLANRGQWEHQYGMALLNDVMRAILPPTFFPVQNSTGWFNSHFNGRAYMGYGMGFSYIGEGYLQGGYYGVVIWTIFLALIVHILYGYSQKGLLGLSIYIFMIPTFIYAMRGDLSYILSPLVKQVLVICLLMSFLFERKKWINQFNC